jgi:hypothetical protein
VEMAHGVALIYYQENESPDPDYASLFENIVHPKPDSLAIRKDQFSLGKKEMSISSIVALHSPQL